MEVLKTVAKGVDAILGLDFLRRHHAKIDLSQQTVELDGKLFPCETTVANVSVSQDAPVMSKVASNELCICALKINSHDKVPPGTGRLIWVPVDSSIPQDVVCLVEPLPSNDVLDEQHCFVRRCVACTRDIGGQLMVPVSVDNFGRDEVSLAKGLLIATLEVCDDEDMEDLAIHNEVEQAVDLAALRKKVHHLEGEDRLLMESLLIRYKNLFNSQGVLPATPITQHRIPTGDNPPVFRKQYRLPKHLQPLVEQFVDQ
jgi:hypothetical protein